ncbi:hypothetical protein [Dyella psychrodurans]|uniref:Uncharacterized protein n=1 Tax=Dyella psychrodurans TaxID=1927960 RepID=A0A370X6T4_9GAMM|nr:hypothetical protein [Dyella psychrodurans]RDS84143.1 hypothetical protein DWU99_10325 [Dyella psychrodurans]
MNTENTHHHEGGPSHNGQVEVAIRSPKGSFPAEGFNAVPKDQRIKDELDRAKRALGIEDASHWVIRVAEPGGGSRPVDPDDTYEGNALRGQVTLEWHPRNDVEVSISTTAGFFPAEGFNTVPLDQKVEEELHKAQLVLKIKDTSNWRVSVVGPGGKRPIVASRTYRENGLFGRVEIDWGPGEGGGG